MSLFSRTKGFALACALALPLVFASTPAHAAPALTNDDVKVQVNDKLVVFPDAQPFIDPEQHKLQVPARIIADQLGLKTSWTQNGSDIQIALSNEKTTVSFTLGNPTISINGQASSQTYNTALIDGRAYVPFRLISDAFGMIAQWDGTNRIGIYGTDGKYYAPAWYAPKYEKVIEAKATAYTASPSENGWGARDYMGNPLQLGTIAVDPSVIPLGSKVYIEGYSFDGLPQDGMFATATDVGSAVKGNKIDIFVPVSKSKAYNFGIQQVKIYVLK
ncbi:3D domain-containing protein [Paenibacillus sp. GD4]|uniref:stalk domain-containing protein n=1 Tax=Paenibacillus sp. GD4 TaxID=3068890 RepID=UPI00279699EF|nr:3D domain-containing protein [Paenibacillus sp. GD4]MDQ1910629.1 3D domain-containing protein [Paenibacillus sp. GD4]